MSRLKFLPHSPLGKIAAVIWLSLCFFVLAFGYIQRDVHDMPQAFIWFMLYLSFPIGSVVSFSAAMALNWFYQFMGWAYVPFRDELPFWLVAVLVGYWQWFLLLPWLFKKLLMGRHRDA